MYKAVFILLFCSFTFNKSGNNRYEKIFPADFSNAIHYLNTHATQFKQSAVKYNNNPELLSTIVFPELMRYSNVKDIIETSALELVYINGGSNAADFSIGRFQMKPSFAEQVEQELELQSSLKNIYKELKYKQNNKLEERRQERLTRLESLKWQLVYLNAFVSICNLKFLSQNFETKEDSISFYASAYNTGFTKTAGEIKLNAEHCYFPYGAKYKGKQYSYADVACYYNNYLFGKPNKSLTLK